MLLSMEIVHSCHGSHCGDYTHYSREKSRLYSTFQYKCTIYAKGPKKKKRLKKNSFPFYSCSTEEINSHNDIFTHRNENPAEALLNWYLFCTILDEDTDLVLVIQLLSSSVRGR